MKKKLLLAAILLAASFLASCKKDTLEKYVDDSANSLVTDVTDINDVNHNDIEDNDIEDNDTEGIFDINDYNKVLHYDEENDLYLVGIYEDDEEKIMVYYQGDKCFINHFFSNGYGEMPQVELKDADDDGEDEIIVSVRKYSGNQTAFSFFVCDKVDDTLLAFPLENIGELVREQITYSYDISKREFIFNCGDNYIIADLPDYIDEYPLTGDVEYEHRYWYDCNMMELTVCPEIKLKNSLPGVPVYIRFEIKYLEGEIEIKFKSFEYSDYYE